MFVRNSFRRNALVIEKPNRISQRLVVLILSTICGLSDVIPFHIIIFFIRGQYDALYLHFTTILSWFHKVISSKRFSYTEVFIFLFLALLHRNYSNL